MSDPFTDFMKACYYGRTHICRSLLVCNPGIVNKTINKKGPIHAAIPFHDIVMILRENGANLELKDDLGRTPLHLASNSSKGMICLVYLLEHGANINATDIYGSTPLHLACEKNDPNMVYWLLLKGAKMDIKDNNGKTPMECTTSRNLGYYEIQQHFYDFSC
jgi:ankyrin repeat protein